MKVDAYIAAAWRTPFSRSGGPLAALSAQQLATETVRPALEKVPALPGLCDVILGNVLNGRGNLARYAGLAAGLGVEVPGVTIDRQCASGMEAVVQAAWRVERADGPATVVAGGVESMSTAPFLMARPSRAYDRRPPEFLDIPLSPPAVGDPSMIATAETVSTEAGITRDDMDRFALRSHERAIAARARNNGHSHVVALQLPGGETAAEDVGPRADTSLARLQQLRPVVSGGTVTAGNASGVSDGGAAVVVMNEAALAEAGVKPLARIRAFTCVGVDPNRMGIGPVAAVDKLLADCKLARADIADWEINEAFAGQILAVLKRLGVSGDSVNPDGGAIALGHPLGASGARILGELALRLSNRPQGTRGIASLCVGGGIGMAVLLESAA